MERKPLQPLNYQLTLEKANLQPFGVRSTLALAAMSCPYVHSPSCFRKGSTQMCTLLDSLHRPHAYLPTMAPRSSNMEHSTPTSTGHQKVPRDWDGNCPEPSRESCGPSQHPTLVTRQHHHHRRCEDEWNGSLCNHQITS